MNRFVVMVLSLFLTVGCSSGAVRGDNNMQVGFRTFYLTRSVNGNLPLITNTDIPNDFQCKILEQSLTDDEDNRMIYFHKNGTGFLVNGGNGNKVLTLQEDAHMYYMNRLNIITSFKDLYSLNLEYFCTSQELALNGKIDEYIDLPNSTGQQTK